MKITNDYHQNTIQQYIKQTDKKEDKVDIADKKDTAVLLEISIEGREAIELKDKNEFSNEIIHYDKSANHLPSYSGIYDVDKTIATAVEGCDKDEKGFVYDIIHQNFLIEDSTSMTEEERQANISLGMKKAEYAMENFIPEDKKKLFFDAMETVAKLASAGKTNQNGKMDYAVKKASYLGSGSNLVETTNTVDMMKRMDPSAYSKYLKIQQESGEEDRAFNTLKYMTNWYIGAVKSDGTMVDKYESQSKKYVDKSVKNLQIDTTFDKLNTDSMEAFMDSLKKFQNNNPGFLSNIIDHELTVNLHKFSI